jgi:hypothetical protein
MLTHHFKPLDRCRPLDNLGLPCISFNVATLSIKNKQKAVQGAEVKLSFYRLRRRAQSETSSRSRFQSSHDQQKWLRTERSGKSAFHSLSVTGTPPCGDGGGTSCACQRQRVEALPRPGCGHGGVGGGRVRHGIPSGRPISVEHEAASVVEEVETAE